MHSYSFDQKVNRQGTSCLKYDFGMQRMGRRDLLPLWVADMDFPLPDEILDILKQRVAHGIFGYTDPDDSYYEALTGWFARRHGWSIRREWNTVTPGVVYALAAAVRAFTRPGDAILIQEPVYYPFHEVIEQNGRICVRNPLRLANGHYEMDLSDLEQRITKYNVRLMLLCSPHNPVGRVWTRDELTAVGHICRKHQVLVVADEIHADFVFQGYHFTPYGTLDRELVQNAVICTSPSKSFNIAGLQTANILIPNPELRTAFQRENAATGYSQGNVLGITAVEAVCNHGDAWLDALLAYLQGNLAFFREFLRTKIPEISLIEPEGTYLLWVDFSHAVSSYEELHCLIVDKAHLWLDEGIIFGKEHALFMRFNIACPRSTLEQALTQLEKALHG